LSQNTSRLKRDADNAQNRLSQVLREIKQADMDLASRKQVLSHQENRARIRLSELHQSISTAQRQHKDEIIRLEGAKVNHHRLARTPADLKVQTEFDREKKMEAKHRATTRETAAALDALTNRKQQAEQEAQAAEDDATRLRDTIRRAETELGDLRAAIKDASATLDQMRTSKPEDMNMNVPEVSLVNFLSPTTSYEDALKIKAERRMEPGQETREHYIGKEPQPPSMPVG
jgi:chromosome segregation ATPase